MSNILKYKDYFTIVNFSAEDGVLYGKIEEIEDLVTFEGENSAEIEQAFHEAVDDYLEYCAEVGKEPEKAYKGSFNIRIAPKLHRAISILAKQSDESLNQTVERAIQRYVEAQPTTKDIAERIDELREEAAKSLQLQFYNAQAVGELWDAVSGKKVVGGEEA